MNKQRIGFTLVELIVVIAAIGILIAIATLGLNKFLAEGRDAQRSADVGVMSERLEKYFDKYGEYPVCSSLQGNVLAISNGVIAIESDALVAPSSKTPDSSSIKCSALSLKDDSYAYVGTDCDSGLSCSEWALQYYEENSESIVTIKSRRIASNAPPPEIDPGEEEPTTPVTGPKLTVEEATDICNKDAPAPAGYNIINAPGGGLTVYGTPGLDLIFGGSGLNIIYGGAGDDILCGNTGTDRVFAEDGDDYIIGGSGLDEIYGGLGNDLLSGDSAADEIYGNEGDDLLYGGSGTDTLDGGPGNDRATDPSGGNYISIEMPF